MNFLVLRGSGVASMKRGSRAHEGPEPGDRNNNTKK